MELCEIGISSLKTLSWCKLVLFHALVIPGNNTHCCYTVLFPGVVNRFCYQILLQGVVSQI